MQLGLVCHSGRKPLVAACKQVCAQSKAFCSSWWNMAPSLCLFEMPLSSLHGKALRFVSAHLHFILAWQFSSSLATQLGSLPGAWDASKHLLVCTVWLCCKQLGLKSTVHLAWYCRLMLLLTFTLFSQYPTSSRWERKERESSPSSPMSESFQFLSRLTSWQRSPFVSSHHGISLPEQLSFRRR